MTEEYTNLPWANFSEESLVVFPMLSSTKILVGRNLFDFLQSHFSLLEFHSPGGEVRSREIEAAGVS